MNWQERVKIEKRHLFEKITKLNDFLEGPIDPDISDNQIRLMKAQLHIMILYNIILDERLEAK